MNKTEAHSDNIILVGNGPSVLTSHRGAFIDSFGDIVRFNGFRLDGFEAHVGRKTTIWSRWYALPEMRHASSADRIWINMPTHERTPAKMREAMALLDPHHAKAEVVPSLETAMALHGELFHGRPSESKWPSSGLLAIAHCLSLAKNVYLVGFDSWATEPYHYYEHHDRSNSHHVAELERDYIDRLAQAGKVTKL